MVANWNPNSPTIQGLAWPVLRKGGSVVDGRRAAAARIVPTVTQTVTHVSLYADQVAGSGVYQLDVWKESDLPATLLQSTFRPNEDKQPGGFSTFGTGSTRYDRVNEATLDTTNGTFKIVTNTIGTGSPPKPSGVWVGFGMGSAAGLGAGAQVVTSVEVHAVVGCVLGATPSLLGVNFYGVMNERPHADAKFVTPTMGAVEQVWTFDKNPATDAAWTEQDIIDLDDTAKPFVYAGVAHWSPNGPGVTGDEGRIYQFWIVVNYFNDSRLATLQQSITTDGWVTFDVADFTKTNAQNLVTILRRISGSGQLVVPSLDSGATAPSSPGAYRPSFDALGNASALNALLTEAHPIQFRVAGAASVDSQPYVDLVRSPVDAAHTVSQEFTAGSTASRQWVQLVVGSSRHQKPAADLTVKIKNSGGGQVGGTGTIPASRIADAPYVLQVLDVVLASAAALTNATQYSVELTCAAPAGQGWDVAVLDAKNPPVSGYSSGFGGGTDRVTIGGVEYNDLDAITVVGIAPTAPSGLAVTSA